jgi:eukaryotic-like serine/threonine-protein kinase
VNRDKILATDFMNQERWQKIKEVLGAALERTPAERAALLDEACADDSALRSELESLIASYEEEQGFLEMPAFDPRPAFSDVEGRLIGPYKIIRQLDHGGMGTVYLAARADDQYRKRVAIKVVKRGMDTEAILSRFRHERQILASLDHPNIARLLDGGSSKDGLPYLVMEYIEGKPINQYCDDNRLTTAERLKLFRLICSGLHYAHQNLVVHRDIKPSNILVTVDGTPKLLDFGIAKLLNPELYSQTLVPTILAARPMTPDYASPEQVRGRTITTASDIYSLGVLLYELLTGHPPYRIHSASPQEIERVVCEQEPEKPSTAINRTEEVQSLDGSSQVTITPQTVSQTREGQPEKLSRKLKGDLDNIILMAMRKEPRRRYASVEQLSEDIRRHLEGLTVIARKDTLSYRTGKFIGRHKAAVAAASLFFVLVAGFVITTIVQSGRVGRERDKAERISAFLVDLFKVSDPGEARGNTVTAREILDKGAERIDRELADQPEVQATLLGTIGQVYRRLGLHQRAVALFERSLEIRRGTLGAENAEVAESINNLAWAFYDKGDYPKAIARAEEAVAMRRKLFGNEHKAVAESLNLLAISLMDKGDHKAAIPMLTETLALRRKILGNEHMDVAQSLNNLGLAYHTLANYPEAEVNLGESLAIYKKLLGGGEHPEIANTTNSLAMSFDNQGKYEEAERLYRESLAMYRKLFGNENQHIARVMNNLGTLLLEQARYDEAEPLYRDALAMYRKLVGDSHPTVAVILHNLARLLSDRGSYAEAEPLFRESLVIFRKLLGEEHPRIAKSLNNLGLLLLEKGNLAEAEQLIRRALEMRRKMLRADHPDISSSLVALGRMLAQNNDAGAEPLLREGLDIQQKSLPAGNWQIAETQSILGYSLATAGRHDEAEPLLVQGYEGLKTKRGQSDRRTRQARARLVDLYKKWGKPEKAAQYLALTQ